MALDRDRVIPIADVRRHVALRAYGAMRMLERTQGAVEDVEGAVARGQYGVVAYQARITVLNCLSVRSLAHGGEIFFDADSVSFDPFAGLADSEIAEAVALANEALDVDDRDSGAWLQRLQCYVADTEALLGYDGALPVLRSPEGPFALLATVRRWTDLLDELDLPGLLPPDWTSGQSDHR